MPIRLGVDHASTKHRFIQQLTMQVTADGAVVPEVDKLSQAGARRFDVPDTAASVQLDITVPAPLPGIPDLVRIQQQFNVSAAGGAPTLVPTGSPPALAPRLSVARSGAARTPPGVYRLGLDVEFLDMTSYWLAINAGGPLFTTTQGSQLVILERTRGTPAAWVVLVPPLARAASAQSTGLLMFLRPTSDTHTSVDDLGPKLAGAARYLGDQVAVPPFGMGKLGEFPDYDHQCGFERQLVASGKPVVLAWPFPNGGDYGAVITASMPDMIRSLVVALWDAGRIGIGAPSVGIGRFALAGYSRGGLAALDCFANFSNRSFIDELYLFDPGQFPDSLQSVAPFQQWLDGAPARFRLLRMIGGGFQHGRMLAFAASLARQDATCFPATATAWFTDPSYQIGLSPAGTPLVFTAAGSPAAPGTASGDTGIFTRSFTAGTSTVPSRLVLTGAGQRFTLLGVAPEEAASIVRVHALDTVNAARTPPLPPGTAVTAATFAGVMAKIRANEDAKEPDRIQAIRHEWTVFGGADFGNGYRGFLQQCLELSGF